MLFFCLLLFHDARVRLAMTCLIHSNGAAAVAHVAPQIPVTDGSRRRQLSFAGTDPFRYRPLFVPPLRMGGWDGGGFLGWLPDSAGCWIW